MKLTIIVPMYNVEATIGRCVRSITAQTFADYELLLVDDGSPDGSASLAESFAMDDSRITVLHKANGGLSSARNYALDRCRGDYVTFVDGDDEIAPGTLEAVMDEAAGHADCDIIEYPVTERVGRPDEHLFNPGAHVYADCMDWLARFGLSHCWVCNKVFRRRLFDHGARFAVGRRFEDVLLLPHLLLQRPRIATTDRGMYLYHWNGSGIVATTPDLTPLLEAQTGLISLLGIDTRRRRWHRLYVDMLSVQLYVYRATGRIMLRPQRLALTGYGRTGYSLKAAAVNVLGLRLTCKIFKLLKR